MYCTRQIDLSASLREHVAVPSVFASDVVFDVQDQGGSWRLQERKVATPFEKDYDSAENPLEWLGLDTSAWVLVSAFEGQERVGGAVGAFGSPGIDMLEGRQDLAVVWDLRVAPHARRHGVATALLDNLEGWAREQGCIELKVETQNTNFAACNFYRRHGFILRQVNRCAYPAYPDEVQLFWRKGLG